MMTAAVFRLIAEKDAVLPLSHGVMTHAAALDLFLRHDASLSRKLHNEGRGRPLAVSTLSFDYSALNGREVEIKAGQTIEWRVAGLNTEVSSFLRSLNPGWGLRIGSCLFEAFDIALSSSEHSDAGSESYQEIVDRWNHCSTEKLPSEFVFEFVSPTTFRHGTMTKPFPAPEIFWASLMTSWNQWSSAFCPEISLALQQDVLLSNWRGETRSVEMGERRTIGFVGRFSYRAMNQSERLRRLMAILADFSFYSGAGWQTTAGMGQIRWTWRQIKRKRD